MARPGAATTGTAALAGLRYRPRRQRLHLHHISRAALRDTVTRARVPAAGDRACAPRLRAGGVLPPTAGAHPSQRRARSSSPLTEVDAAGQPRQVGPGSARNHEPRRRRWGWGVAPAAGACTSTSHRRCAPHLNVHLPTAAAYSRLHVVDSAKRPAARRRLGRLIPAGACTPPSHLQWTQPRCLVPDCDGVGWC